MSKRQFFLLLCFFCFYLLLGAVIFLQIESLEERKEIEKRNKQEQNIRDLLHKFKVSNSSINKDDLNILVEELEGYCGKPLKVIPRHTPKWDFYHALFFVITVVSTIGYGNLAPTTMFGRIFMIFYGLVGIPINGIVMVTLGDFFGKSFTKLYSRWKNSREKNLDTTRLGLISQVVLYLTPGFTLFIFVPSIVIMYFEEWEYDKSVYYAFVTLTTIGFGDYVAGLENKFNLSDAYYIGYQIFLLIWIIGGLGYVIMILNFIARGMRSKKLQKLETKIATNIFVRTPNKIRDELRNFLQELLLVRIKKVYKQEFIYEPTKLERSVSCPNLVMHRKDESSSIGRKRAKSECPRTFILERIQSDTDLERIDKEMTFHDTDTTDLLIKVVDALSINETIPELKGYDGFSDEEILDSERFGSSWSIGNQQLPIRPRKRAASEFRIPSIKYQEPPVDHTWYGQAFTRPFARILKNARSASQPEIEHPQATPPTFFQRLKSTFKPKQEAKLIDVEKQNERISSNQITAMPFSTASCQQNILEQTSLADFIRALTTTTDNTTDLVPQPRKRTNTIAGLPLRARRMPIRSNFMNRRSSLMPPSPTEEFKRSILSRRSSLAPSTPSADASNFQRGTLLPNFRHSASSSRRFSLTPVQENQSAPPPPYSLFPSNENISSPPLVPSKIRRFSIKPATVGQAFGPVQRQLTKRERTDSEKSDNEKK